MHFVPSGLFQRAGVDFDSRRIVIWKSQLSIVASDDLDLYVVISDPAALGSLEQDQTMFGSSSSSRVDVNPALIRLSFEDIKPDRPAPTFVLPIGRMVVIFDPYGRRDLMMDRASRQDLEIMDSDGRHDLKIMEEVDGLLKGNTAFVEDFSLSAWRSIYGITSNTSAMPIHAPETQTYIKEIATKLAKGSQIAGLRKDQDLEQRRCEVWRAMLRQPHSFQDTSYVVVVDAVDPHHPVWLIRSRKQQNQEVEWEYVSENTLNPPPFPHAIRGEFDAAKIFSRLFGVEKELL
ncbi:MAG: hypothetical protein M1814_006643 [Vezdaea aestivalis]|nr:MAG: hypothetical protein M1814_006643 [Vezdaea aestivalis]